MWAAEAGRLDVIDYLLKLKDENGMPLIKLNSRALADVSNDYIVDYYYTYYVV